MLSNKPRGLSYMNNKKKTKLSNKEIKSRKLQEDINIKKYKISQIVIKQDVTFEEAEFIYNLRIQKQHAISGREKRKGTRGKNNDCDETHSVYSSLSGVTNARTWNKVK